MRFLLWMPLVVSLSVAPVAADQINFSSLAALEATGIGPRIAHRQQHLFDDGRYDRWIGRDRGRLRTFSRLVF